MGRKIETVTVSWVWDIQGRIRVLLHGKFDSSDFVRITTCRNIRRIYNGELVLCFETTNVYLIVVIHVIATNKHRVAIQCDDESVFVVLHGINTSDFRTERNDANSVAIGERVLLGILLIHQQLVGFHVGTLADP